MKNMSSDNLVFYDCIDSTTVVSYLSRSEKLAEFRESVLRTCSEKVANSCTENDYLKGKKLQNWLCTCIAFPGLSPWRYLRRNYFHPLITSIDSKETEVKWKWQKWLMVNILEVSMEWSYCYWSDDTDSKWRYSPFSVEIVFQSFKMKWMCKGFLNDGNDRKWWLIPRFIIYSAILKR